MPLPSTSPGLPPLVLTDDQFEDMARKGAFARVGRIELRDGVLTPVNPIHVPHSRIAAALLFALRTELKRARGGLAAIGEVSIRFGRAFQPIPDIVVYEKALVPPSHEGPMPGASVRLAIEVSDSALSDDLGPKCRSYAAAGVPEYWVVDVRAEQVIQHAEPAGEGEGAEFQVRRAVPLDGPLRAVTFDLTLPAGALDD